MAASDADNALMLATIDVNLTRLEKSLARANALVSNNAKGMGRNLGAANKRLQVDLDRTAGIYSRATKRIKSEAAAFRGSLVGAFGAGFVGGAAAGLLVELPRMFGAITSSLRDLRAEAEKAGIDVESFQELKYAAGQVRIPVDALADGLKELQLRGDEFVRDGAGPAADAFRRLGFNADDLKARLADPVALFDEIIKRLKTLDTAAQIRIADEVFGGTAGERFVSLLAKGTKSLGEMRQEARAVGAVFDAEMIDKVVEIDRKFEQLSTTVSFRLKGAIVEAAVALDGLLQRLETTEKAGADEIRRRFAALFDERNALFEERARLRGSAGDPFTDQQLARIEERLRQLDDLERQYNDALQRLRQQSAPKTDGASTPPTPVPSSTSSTSRAPVPESRSSALRERAERLQDVVDALDEERLALGRSAVENEALQRIREAGVALDSAEAQAIRTKVAALHAERAAREAATDAAERAKDAAERAAEEALRSGQAVQQVIGDSALDLFKGATQGADGFAAALKNVADRLADLVLQAVLLGQGPLASIFGMGGQNGGVGGLIGLALGNPTGPVAVAPSATPAGVAPVASVPLPAVTQAVQTATTSAMEIARGWEGVTESGQPAALSKFFQTAGFSLDPRQTAWCAAFANAALAQAGIEGTGSLAARSFETWGEGVDPSQAMPGDVAVFSRPSGGPNAGHVGFFAGYNPDGSIRVLGGNQGNSVSYADMPASQLLGFRRAPQMLEQSATMLANTATGFTSDFSGSLGQIASGTANAGGGFLGAFGGALNSIVGGLGGDAGGGLGILGSIFSGFTSLFGFADGGYTGPGRKHEPAGVVHRGEFVFDKRSVDRIGVQNLERLRRLPGFAEGGFVDPRRARLPALGAGRAGAGGSQVITIAPKITVNAAGGTPAQNDDLARKIGKEVEGSVRGLVTKELLQQKRPGGLLSR